MESSVTRHTVPPRLGCFTHLLCICLVLVLPELMLSISQQRPGAHIPPDVYFKIGVYLAVFYLNYLFIIDRTLFRHKTLWFVMANVLLITASLAALAAVWQYFREHIPQHTVSPDSAAPPVYGVLPGMTRDFSVILLLLMLCVAIKGMAKNKDLAKRRNELLAARRESELAHLRAQLNPHFFFNTLNAIYALIEINRNKAREAIHRLSKMMRYMLYETPVTASMPQELDFIRNYLALMMMRLSPGFPVKITLPTDDEVTSLRIAPIIFINLIENAFKYGMEVPMCNACIEISLSADPLGVVTFRASNSYLASARASRPEGAGIGLNNLRRRLSLRYPGAHTLDIRDTGNRFEVTLTIDTLKSLK